MEQHPKLPLSPEAQSHKKAKRKSDAEDGERIGRHGFLQRDKGAGHTRFSFIDMSGGMLLHVPNDLHGVLFQLIDILK